MADKKTEALPAEVAEMLLDASTAVDPGTHVADRLRTRLLDRVRRQAAPVTPADQLVTISGGGGEWIETGPGNSIKVLRSDEETMSMLVRLRPGTTFPEHYHPADEETYVIEGDAWFGDIHLVAGDYHLAPKGTTHGEIRTEKGCMLLIRKASE